MTNSLSTEMVSNMNVNVTEVVTLEKADSVVHFKNKITDTIDFLLKSHATSHNSAVQFNININLSEFKGTSNFNKETNTNQIIVREINNTTNEEDPKDKTTLCYIAYAWQQRIALKSTAVRIIKEKIQGKILVDRQKSFERNKRRAKRLSRRQKARGRRAISMMGNLSMENQAETGIKRKHESNEENETTQQIHTEQENRLTETDTTPINVSEENQISENKFAEPKRSDMWKLQMIQRQTIEKSYLLNEPEASGSNGQERLSIVNNVLGESSRMTPTSENYSLDDYW